jgi:hypothetical protein
MEVNLQKWWYLGSYSILETMKYYIYRLYQVHIYLELEHPPPTFKLNDLHYESGILQVKLHHIHCNDFAQPLKKLLDCKSLHNSLCNYRNKYNEPENVKFSIRILLH